MDEDDFYRLLELEEEWFDTINYDPFSELSQLLEGERPLWSDNPSWRMRSDPSVHRPHNDSGRIQKVLDQLTMTKEMREDIINMLGPVRFDPRLRQLDYNRGQSINTFICAICLKHLPGAGETVQLSANNPVGYLFALAATDDYLEKREAEGGYILKTTPTFFQVEPCLE